jgi:AcrR family transcriptional regulator
VGRPRKISDAQIAAVARRMFLKHGPSVSSYAIAAELGVSQPALFKRVKTKQGLLQAAFAPRAPPAFARTLAEGPRDGVPVREQLVAIAEQMTRFLRELVPALVILKASRMTLRDVIPAGVPPPRQLALHALAGWIDAAQKRGEVRGGSSESMAALLLGTVEARCFLEHIDGRKLAAAAVRRELVSLIDSLWSGMAPSR